MKKILILTMLSMSMSIFANDTIKSATEAGLKPLPTKNEEIMKLIDNPKNKLTVEKFHLGKKLYFDPRLSKSGLISCNTCHNLATGGVDGVSAAVGHKWTENPHGLNSPTVYNAVLAEKQFWDGRSPDLEDQAQGPIQAMPEMAATPEHIKQVVNSIPEYKEAFQKIKGDENYEATIKDVADMIAVYERTLITISKYDQFLSGDEKALNNEEQKGLQTFIDKGCVSCHTGYALGGGMQPFPIITPYKYASGDFKGDENGMVKVPTLRNIEETAPYFHNGKVWTLKETIDIMGKTQLGINLTEEEITSIETFLKTLTGKKPDIKYPILPNRAENTNKPQIN